MLNDVAMKSITITIQLVSQPLRASLVTTVQLCTPWLGSVRLARVTVCPPRRCCPQQPRARPSTPAEPAGSPCLRSKRRPVQAPKPNINDNKSFLDHAIATRGQTMRMRFLTLFAAVCPAAALALSASAADLSMPPIYNAPLPTYFTWTGWYVGLNGGGGWGQTSHTATVNAIGLPPATTGNFNTSGGLGGGTIGYNYQMGQWLVGAEADLDWS